MADVFVNEQVFTNIANQTRRLKNSQDTYKPSEMATALSTVELGIIPTGELNITENGTYNVTNYASAKVQLSGVDNNAKMNTVIPDYANRFIYYNITNLPESIDISNLTEISNMFMNFKSLIELPQMDTSNIVNIQGLCSNCTNLTTVPVYNTGKVYEFSNAFVQCPSLSNNSLNNILLMCANSVPFIASYKTLKKIGLTSEQATICTGLSNWATAQAAGWTTGY